MPGTTMVFLIVLIAVGFGTVREIYAKRLEMKKLDGMNQSEKQAMQEEIKQLKSRVATLEQIITDDGYQVAKEINKL
ncbi:hypothetical protein CWB99_11160 [Pseudoalteromonas rubra]|jgi:cell division protein FtsL|uniref:Nitrite reductase n=1 Tax=Pseudoalteromonas rubra TaxID=43658 RepID=A0A0F4QK53_9GAMM|nr:MULTISPECIES: hypothetical protein [Pseudoalteromonas]AZZ98704.1 hypothetical protein ELR70_17330 [Pseudoalteromonas sp. R3]KJZ07655.1 hypothetical protein TW77_14820 [Pseudoalteromonas rubra]MCF2910005.1 hypothetical protein [Pseudoalteromonas sp. DL2-H2.2]MCO7190398.1 hypothetical protein [Pseudoalteromonas sp. XMcav2-N]TMP28633.1 hypothetical protein CWB99_11160 [Pseudoalteromonas rubra]